MTPAVPSDIHRRRTGVFTCVFRGLCTVHDLLTQQALSHFHTFTFTVTLTFTFTCCCLRYAPTPLRIRNIISFEPPLLAPLSYDITEPQQHLLHPLRGLTGLPMTTSELLSD